MNRFQNKYRIQSTRATWWDYASNGCYFVTLCTENKLHYFGEIALNVETQDIASLIPTRIGEIAEKYWLEIPTHFPFVTFASFVVMPNHLHGIIKITKSEDIINKETQNFASPSVERYLKKNKFGPQSKNLASIIRGYKAAVKKYTTMNNMDFSWQPLFHDHIIRDNEEKSYLVNYIKTNPANWEKDNLFSSSS